MMHVQHVEACPDIGPICELQFQVPYQHDQHLYSDDLVLDADFGLLKYLSVEAVFALRQTTDRIRFLDLNGAPYVPPVPDYHHKNETLVGPTDPWLMAHAGRTVAGFAVSGRAGLTFPLGSTVPNPFALGALGLPHEHIQFGDGTWDPVLGASIERQLGGVTLALWTLDRLVVGTNHYGYRSGDKYLAGVAATSGFGLRRFVFTGGVDLYSETAETWDGQRELEGNLGRTDLLLDLNVAWLFAKGWSANVGLKVPVFSWVVGEQASYPGIVTLGISTDAHFVKDIAGRSAGP